MNWSVEIEEREFPILANLFRRRFTVSYPLYDLTLFSVEPDGPGYGIRFIAEQEDFDGGASVFDGHVTEMPFFTDYDECLLASGVTSYENLEEFAGRLRTYRELKKDVRFGIDTNLLYHRFVTVTGAINPEETILPDIVRQEVEYALNHKYSSRFIADLQASAPASAEIIGEFENRKKKKSRKAAYLAMAEYRDLRDRALLLTTGADAAHTSRENDGLIVRALRRFEEERFSLPVLLTADAAMADLCDAEGVEYFLFRSPYHERPATAGFDAFFRLLAYLSVVFGVIDLGSVLIFSEYGGKGNDSSAFRLTFMDEDLHTEFVRDVEVCRKLLALRIGR